MEEAEKMAADSQKHLEKFLKEKPDHPAAVSAMVTWGDLSMDRAMKQLRQARALEDKEKEQAAKHLTDARTALGEAEKQLKQAVAKFQARLVAMPKVPEATGKNKRERDAALRKREAVMGDWLDARGKAALVQYYVAQTYADAKDPARKAALESAHKQFDGIYQSNRVNEQGQVDIVGLFAHMWDGKVMEEMGDLRTAQDIYEEVLANAPDPGEGRIDPNMENLFTQVENFRLLILSKQKPAEFLQEAEQWLRAYNKLKETDGYQGIALQVVKAKLAMLPKASGAEKAKLTTDVSNVLKEMSKIISSHQQDAIRLKRKLAEEGGGSVEATNFDDAVAFGNDAAETGRWDEAIKNYEKALEFAEKTKIKEPERKDAVREALAKCKFQVARTQFSKNQLDDSLKTINELVKQFKESPTALSASALGVSVLLNKYAAAPPDKKEEVLGRLVKAANFLVDNWANKPEADDARMALGTASLINGKIDEALKVFENVNPKSERYGAALFQAGSTYWGRYNQEKNKPEENRNNDQMAADLGKARERLAASLELQRKPADPGKKPEPGKEGDKKDTDKKAADERAALLLHETQLLLGEVYVESNQAKEAIAFFEPLLAALKAEKPQNVDKPTLRTFVGAVRSYLAGRDLQRAGEAASLLAEVGPDVQMINGWLIEFAKLMNNEYKQADADLISAPDAQAKQAAQAKLDAAKAPLGEFLKKIGGRQMSPQAMVFVGDTLAAVGLTDDATVQYDAILKRIESDEAFGKAAAKAVTRVRTQVVELQARKGNYEAALKQVEELIKANPKALEPMMTKGRILVTWAEKSPDKWADAVQQWARIRERLMGLQKRPDEFYEVTYNVANCLYLQAKASKEKSAMGKIALDGEKLLKGTLIQTPKLSGPDMVARYNDLIAKLAAAQGRKPSPVPAATAKRP
jgi:hypothetical protein